MAEVEQMRKRTEDWSAKLKGHIILPDPTASANTFQHADLPPVRRICPPGSMMTRDMQEDRLNIFTDHEGRVSHVTMG